MGRFLYGFILCLLLVTAAAADSSLTRGPYINRTSDTVTIIRWRTSTADTGKVTYGTNQENLNLSLSSADLTTEHRFEISGLSPDTTYYYKIGSLSSDLTTNDGTYFFRTNPSPGTAKDVRIWVIGDSGLGNANALAVRDSYLNFVQTYPPNAHLWLMLGDNAYPRGLDNEYDTGLFNAYPNILKNTVLWPTIGNHDAYARDYAPYNSGQTIPYYASFSLPRNAQAGGTASGTESYYSFDYGDVHLISLNSYEEDRSPSGAMATWLKEDLAATTARWRIAYWHHAPYSRGSHNSDTDTKMTEMRTNILPILEDCGVDLVLGGHSHSYERSVLLDSHYGTSDTLTQANIIDGSTGAEGYLKPLQSSPHFGTVYVVNGTAASVEGGGLNHPAMSFSAAALGSMIIDISSDTLEGKFINSLGQVLDNFKIIKAYQTVLPESRTGKQGRVRGRLSRLESADSRSQKLTIDGAKSPGLIQKYTFNVPDNFVETFLLLKAWKDSVTSPDFQLLYSSDGTNYTLLRTIRRHRPSAGSVKLSIPPVAGNPLYLKIRNKKTSDNRGSLLIDQLILTNN